jgi:hypothetical protein
MSGTIYVKRNADVGTKLLSLFIHTTLFGLQMFTAQMLIKLLVLQRFCTLKSVIPMCNLETRM